MRRVIEQGKKCVENRKEQRRQKKNERKKERKGGDGGE